MRTSISRCLGLLAVLPAAAAHGAATPPLATYNFGASTFVEDGARSIIYATIPALNSVAVINANTYQVTNTIGIGSNPSGLALSPDGSRLYVANSGSSFIGVLNTQSLTTLAPLALPSGSPDLRPVRHEQSPLGAGRRLDLSDGRDHRCVHRALDSRPGWRHQAEP